MQKRKACDNEEVTCSNYRSSRGGRLIGNTRRDVQLLLCNECSASLLISGRAALLHACSDVRIRRTADQERVMAAVTGRKSI